MPHAIDFLNRLTKRQNYRVDSGGLAIFGTRHTHQFTPVAGPKNLLYNRQQNSYTLAKKINRNET